MLKKLKALVILGAGVCLSGATHAVAHRADLGLPELALINGRILTLDGRSSVAGALAVRDGKILATGNSASTKSLAGPRTRILDLAGKTVVPGMIDTHAHFKAAGLSEYAVNMSRPKTVAEALEAIKTFAARKKPGEWIVGGAWHPPSRLAEKRLERFLGRATADRAVPARTLIEEMGIDSLGAGTDFPVNPINPLLNMYIMVTRKNPNGNVYGASEPVTREQALRLYTSAPARYMFEGPKGTLEPGNLADREVLSADYMSAPENQIKDIKADTTMVGGKVVFQR